MIHFFGLSGSVYVAFADTEFLSGSTAQTYQHILDAAVGRGRVEVVSLKQLKDKDPDLFARV